MFLSRSLSVSPDLWFFFLFRVFLFIQSLSQGLVRVQLEFSQGFGKGSESLIYHHPSLFFFFFSFFFYCVQLNRWKRSMLITHKNLSMIIIIIPSTLHQITGPSSSSSMVQVQTIMVFMNLVARAMIPLCNYNVMICKILSQLVCEKWLWLHPLLRAESHTLIVMVTSSTQRITNKYSYTMNNYNG